MHQKKEPGPEILALARRQAGVVSRKQLIQHDAPPKARRRWALEWTTMAPGYYCLTEPTWESWCWAGLLRAATGGVLTGAAAGHLHGFVQQEPRLITIAHQHTTTLPPMLSGPVDVVFRRSARTGRGTPARASVEDALLDHAGECDEVGIVAAVTRALAEGMTTTGRLHTALGSRGRVRHRDVIGELCGLEGIESALEWRFLDKVIRAHRLAEPSRQVRLEEKSRSDAHWDEYNVVAELDGRLGHEDVFRDLGRDNRLAALGYVSVRYGWFDVDVRYCQVARQLHEVLRRNGYGEEFHRCVDCRRTDRRTP